MYRLTLLQNMDSRPPAVLQAVYTFAGGPAIWPVTAVGPDTDTAVVVVNCATNLINQPGVTSRALRAHYPTAPNQRDYPISSVQP
jgi:hypothetical protein